MSSYKLDDICIFQRNQFGTAGKAFIKIDNESYSYDFTYVCNALTVIPDGVEKLSFKDKMRLNNEIMDRIWA